VIIVPAALARTGLITKHQAERVAKGSCLPISERRDVVWARSLAKAREAPIVIVFTDETKARAVRRTAALRSDELSSPRSAGRRLILTGNQARDKRAIARTLYDSDASFWNRWWTRR